MIHEASPASSDAGLASFWIASGRSLGEALFALVALCPSVAKARCSLEDLSGDPRAVCSLELSFRDASGKTARSRVGPDGALFCSAALSDPESRAFALFCRGAEALLGPELPALAAWGESLGLSPLALATTPRIDPSESQGYSRDSAFAIAAVESAADSAASWPAPLREALFAAASLPSYPSEDLQEAALALRGAIEALGIGDSSPPAPPGSRRSGL